MARLIFENLTIEQARELAVWYCEQGEQDAEIWFECQDPPQHAPIADVSHKPKWMEVNGNTVTIYCR